MRYLAMESVDAAEARSAMAWEALSPPAGGVTSALWSVVVGEGGGVVLAIPDTPGQCGVDIGQASYDALLSPSERAALENLPDGWQAEGGDI